MAKIRLVEISNFRAIKALKWFPNSGINCLIGAGDSGKSSILEAIDLCLGARRSVSFSDADFHKLETASPIKVELTLGDLEDSIKPKNSSYASVAGPISRVRGGPTAASVALRYSQTRCQTEMEVNCSAASLAQA